jgi:putative redox protein
MDEVRVRSLGKMQQQVIAAPHSLIADEPPAFGGDDLGPNPYELLLAALGTCTSMTLFMYAERKNWDLRSVDIRLVHGRVFGEDCERCEEPDQYLDRVQQNVLVSGDLTNDQVEALLNIASKCPAHKTLSNGVAIEIALSRNS